MAINRLVSALALPVVRVVARMRPLHEEVQPMRRFDARVDQLWERVEGRFALAVTRDARYLNWKFMRAAARPLSRRAAATGRRGRRATWSTATCGSRRAGSRRSSISWRDPVDERGIETLAGWVDREARLEDSDKIRCYATHRGVPPRAAANGYFVVKSGIDVAVKVNAVEVPKDFYQSGDDWHLTLGDGALDH